MVILRSQYKITDFFMILAWASPFKILTCRPMYYTVYFTKVNLFDTLRDRNPINPTTKGFRTKVSMKLVYQYVVIFFYFQTTSNHSNSRLVVDEGDNGKLRIERVKHFIFGNPNVRSKSTMGTNLIVLFCKI